MKLCSFLDQFSAKQFSDSRSELNMSSLELTDLALYLLRASSLAQPCWVACVVRPKLSAPVRSTLRAARSRRAWGLQWESKMTGGPGKQPWAFMPRGEGQGRSRRCAQRMGLHHQLCSKMTFLVWHWILPGERKSLSFTNWRLLFWRRESSPGEQNDKCVILIASQAFDFYSLGRRNWHMGKV